MSLASVNGFLISKLDYLLELAVLTHDETIICAEESIKKDVLVQIIDDTLLLQHAIQQNIIVSNNEVEENFFKTLLDLNSRYDFAEFMIENNLSENELMNHVKNQLIIKKYVKEYLKKDIDISDEKLLEFYNENVNSFESEDTVRISHILIEKYDPDAYHKIHQMRDEINSPADFFDKVRECSDCLTCCQSGDLGYFIRGELIPELDQVVFNMHVNEISQPILSKYGYHILIVTDRKKHNKTPFKKIRDALKEQLIEIETELKLVKLLRELKEKSKIEIYIEV